MVMVCPKCGGAVEELLWIYQGKYYCSYECVPHSTVKYPNTQSQIVDSESDR